MSLYKHLLPLLIGIFILSITTAGGAADQSSALPLSAGTWLPEEVLTTEVLARITGRGIASDLPEADLEKIVGAGFISYLTPDEVAKINTDHILSQEGRRLILGSLVTYADKADKEVVYVAHQGALTVDETSIITQNPEADTDRAPFTVQVGIFKTHDNALSLLKELKKKQYHQAYIFKTKDTQGRLFYAVRLRDYESIKEPYIDAARYKTQEQKPAIITYANALSAIQTDMLPGLTLSAAELAATTGQGFSRFATDMSDEELDKTVGKGIISNLSPEQLEKISASGVLSGETIRLKTQHLAKIIARGVTYMVDESKFTPAELEEIKGRGTAITSIGRLPFSVQVGVYQVRENALAMLKELQTEGYEPYIFQTTNDQGKSLFAVRLGDYETIKSAYAEATHFKRKEHKPAIVTYINSLQAVKPPASEKEEASDQPAAAKMVFTPGKAYPSEDLNQLYQEMLSLRKEIDQLKAEARAREKLRLTEAEETKEEEEILEAVGREYILAEKGTLSLDYSFSYSYNSADLIWTQGEDLGFRIQNTADHAINNTISTSYAWFDNLTVNAAIPFAYKYKNIGGESSRDVSDVGDISVGARWQVLKQTEIAPPLILNATLTIPSGRSPYDINPDKDLSTGSGTWQLALGTALNKTFDPVVVYGSFGLSYTAEQTSLDYNLTSSGATLDKVEASYGLGLGFGIGYAMSYKASLNASVAYSYSVGTTYHYESGDEMETGDASSASLNVGMGWKLDSDRTISVGLGMGLTNATSDFSLSCRIPFDYEL